jgi:Ser-tRNA(Ala) deacylase AlaX
MATSLLYMNDFDVVACDAQVAEIHATDDGRERVVLDQTCFYPRGGGQDWDTGRITGDGGEFAVEEVRLDETGTVQHIGRFARGRFAPGQAVHAAVDSERRTVNTRLHSAGHLVDLAVERLAITWQPGKGAHYPHMSFVEYAGDITPEEAERVRGDIERTANEIVQAGGDNEIRFMPAADMHTVCRHIPENIPKNKPARVVIYQGDFGVPCGGTHVRNLKDIGHVHITKIKAKKGIIKVSYAVEGIT